MTTKKEIILNQQDKANNENNLIEQPEITPKKEAPIPDKLIGDDLEIRKVKDHDEPEIDNSRDILNK